MKTRGRVDGRQCCDLGLATHVLAELAMEFELPQVIHAGVGAVNESDVLLASASNAIVIAFNVRPDRNAEDIAARERVDVRHELRLSR